MYASEESLVLKKTIMLILGLAVLLSAEPAWTEQVFTFTAIPD